MANDRRSFFKKLGTGLIGSVAIVGAKTEKNNMDIKKIIELKPMGFMWDTYDPFLFCVHHEDKFPAGNGEMGPDTSHFEGRSIGDDFIIKDGWRMYHGTAVPGFPGHPHRGFETITVVREGVVDHADSMGASGRYGQGDVQWMTAGNGVQHSEMFPLIHDDKENPLELFQIWLNLPSKNKMVAPHFKMLWGSKIPKITCKDGQNKACYIEVIAGNILDHIAPAPPPDSWAADPSNEVAIFNIKMDANATFNLPKASLGVNRVIYFYEGDTLMIDNEKISNYHSAKVNPTEDLLLVNGNKESKILVLQGRPINETVIQYGPFVMNSKAEIQEAFEDYHKTKFGGWPWSRYDQVHDKSSGRFAKHADGTFEQGV
ncbi:MAG: hypothetical protein RLZZ546_1653 [Bacteroidota bacterium]